MVKYSFLRWVMVLGLLGSATAAEAPGQDLEALRRKISTLQQELQASEATRHAAADSLQASEKAISEANRELARIVREQSLSQTELAKASADFQRTEHQMQQQRRQIRRLLLARYRNGQHEALRLLLNKQDPAQLSRDLHYYRYIAAAQQEQTHKISIQRAHLNGLMVELQNKREALNRLVAERKQQRARLLAGQGERQKVLSQLGETIDQQQREMGKLQEDERRLSALVEKLDKLMRERAANERAASERAGSERATKASAAAVPAPARTGKLSGEASTAADAALEPAPRPAEGDAVLAQTGFADLKGRLSWPLRGDLLGRFGAPKTAGTLWKGVLIKAPTGQVVKAVAPGRVVFADWLRGFGNMVIIDHGEGYLSLYGTAEALLRSVGDLVKSGDDVATTGNSGGGRESGIYFEIRHLGKPVNPQLWMK